MIEWSIVLITTLASSTAVDGTILEIAAMIYNATNHTPSEISRYGKNCGYGGMDTSVDQFDQCCFVHDRCYAKINRDRICPIHELFVPYQWKVLRHDLVCGYEWRRSKLKLACDDRVCACDVALARCLRDKSDYFRRENLRWLYWIKRRGVAENSVSSELHHLNLTYFWSVLARLINFR